MTTDMTAASLLTTTEVRPGTGVLTADAFRQALVILRRAPVPGDYLLPVHPGHALFLQPHRIYQRALRRYARLYAGRPTRRAAWRRLTLAQICHASELWVEGVLVAHVRR